MTPTIKIHNATTGEIIEREMDADELAQWELVQAQEIARAQAKAEAEAKREAALSKLAALGLTADDLRALGL